MTTYTAFTIRKTPPRSKDAKATWNNCTFIEEKWSPTERRFIDSFGQMEREPIYLDRRSIEREGVYLGRRPIGREPIYPDRRSIEREHIYPDRRSIEREGGRRPIEREPIYPDRRSIEREPIFVGRRPTERVFTDPFGTNPLPRRYPPSFDGW
jgi:hypothetical protein